MPQIDVYIFRFFPMFIFVVFIAVYMYVYFLMLPSVVSVLKFRIRYKQTLETDVIKLKTQNMKLELFNNAVFNIFRNTGRTVVRDLHKVYVNELNSSKFLSKLKLFRL